MRWRIDRLANRQQSGHDDARDGKMNELACSALNVLHFYRSGFLQDPKNLPDNSSGPPWPRFHIYLPCLGQH